MACTMTRALGETATACGLKPQSGNGIKGSTPLGPTNYGISNQKLARSFSIKPGLFAEAAEHFAVFFFLSRGYPACKTHATAAYDVIFDDNGVLRRVQVRSSSNLYFNLTKTRNNATGTRRIRNWPAYCY